MKVEITTNNYYAIIEIVTDKGRFLIRNYDKKITGIEYVREQAAELARVLGCKYEEKEL
ncbi:hypothetical protein ES707_05437 [subsurface metagenome]